MEFLLFLTPINKIIINDLIKAKFTIIENALICDDNHQYLGLLYFNKSFIVCTENIKRNHNKKYWFNRVITHEAVHAAQVCKKSSLGYRKENMPLSEDKLRYLEASTRFSNENHKEHEAYYLEDSPQLVRSYIRKFCF